MKTVTSRLVVAVLLAVAAWLSRSESQLAATVADARQAIATFDYTEVDAWTPRASLTDYLGSGRPLSEDIRIAKAQSDYWLRRYEAVAKGADDGAADGEILLASANAAFRQSQRDRAVGPAAVQQLDGVLQAYASAMKAAASEDALASVAVAKEAAYNYEYVARLRDQLASNAQSKTAGAPAAAAITPLMAGDLPAGPTIHGGPGAPPPDAKMEELQTIAPMEYGDREAQPEPTPGARRDRKG